jgi:hypothetical protein
MKNRRVMILAMLRDANNKEIPEVDMGVFVDDNMVEGKVDPPLASILEKLVMYQGFVPNCA